MSDPTFNTGYGMSALRTKQVEPLSIADRRITFGPRIGELIVDRKRIRVPPRAFQTGYTLAENVDEVVSNDDLLLRTTGFNSTTVSETNFKELTRGLDTDIYKLRQLFGEELGDVEYGAIRTIMGIGHTALSEI